MALVEVKINNQWRDLPTPAIYKPTYTHVENSYRDITGKLHRDIVRKNLAKVECGWNCLDETQLAFLQSIYTLTSLSVRFTDNKGNRVTKTMYAGPLTSTTKGISQTTLKMTINTEVAMNFIEV